MNLEVIFIVFVIILSSYTSYLFGCVSGAVKEARDWKRICDNCKKICEELEKELKTK